jgi:hypothetical protein
MKTWVGIVSLSIVGGFAASAVADDFSPLRNQRFFRAQLVSFNEVPSVSSAARGHFFAMLNERGDGFTYWLTYSGLSENASQAHIHFGQHHVNGGISVWLCEGASAAPANVAANVPDCAPRETTMPITGTITAADVVGPPGQGIGAMEFEELLAAMRAGAAYANVHSGAAGPPVVGFPGGEIRGQIN